MTTSSSSRHRKTQMTIIMSFKIIKISTKASHQRETVISYTEKGDRISFTELDKLKKDRREPES